MNIDKAINILHEEWVGTSKKVFGGGGKESYDIFKNPSNKEMREVMENNRYRFIASSQKKILYVFSPSLLHDFAAEELGLLKDYNSSQSKLLFGVAHLNKIESIWKYKILEKTVKKEIKKMDWSWAIKWLNIKEYLDNYKEVKEK